MNAETAAFRRIGTRCRGLPGGAGLVALVLYCGIAVAATEPEYLTVELRPNQTIRQVAQDYLDDADLWPEILKASGLVSVTELVPGAALRIPANEISAANQALVQSLDQIQSANRAGAQIYAPEEIGEALDLREEALLRRLERQWRSTRELANQSFDMATLALEKSEAQRDRAAEALVTDRTGDVEGQRPEDIDWRDLMRLATLIEEEKVRTLSNSTAQITFRDASRLRLNENSNAVIQRMRYDPLSRSEEAKVSLVEGDFYAILSSDKERKRFNVEIPDVNASISSGDFWVSNDQSGAKFANYDDREVRVEARGEVVSLGRNQGTVIDAGERPGEVRQVLPPPRLASPGDGDIVYGVTPELAWAPLDGAAGYWLEIAQDQGFNRLVDSRFGLQTTGYRTEALQPGEYFWRVAALDGFGLPGERTVPASFTVAIDETPPFLRIDAPLPGAIVREASIRVEGEAEPGAALTIDGAPVGIGADGRFVATVAAREGANSVAAVATDAAGNAITRSRDFVYMPDRASAIRFDPALRREAGGGFVTDDLTLSLRGTTIADATIEVRGADGTTRAAAASDGAGAFALNVPLAADAERFEITVTAPSGFSTQETIDAAVDRTAPAIEIDKIPPRLTAAPALVLKGRTEANAALTLNGGALTLTDGRFETPVSLVDGANVFELIATDAAGNVTVDKWTVRLDRDPPQPVGSTVTQVADGAGTSLAIEVAAEDASGLAKAAAVTVTAGSATHSGFLRYNRASGSYRGSVPVPAEAMFQPLTVEVSLTDDAGNTRTYTLPLADEDAADAPESGEDQ